MRTLVLAAAATLVLAARASAADLDADEKTWATQCMERLSSKSARVRAGAERAIGALGFDALPDVLAFVGDSKTEIDRHELARAISAMGPGAAQALDDRRASWPKFTEMLLGGVVEDVRALEEKAKKDAAADAGPPATPEDVEAKVKEILARYENVNTIHSPDAGERALVALGRPAIGALVKVIRDPIRGAHWAVHSKAQSALKSLVGPQDAQMLAKLVREGRVEFVSAFENIDSPEAVELLADFVRHGQFDHALGEAIGERRTSPPIVEACCAWLDEPVHDGDLQHAIGVMADVVGGGGHGPFHGPASAPRMTAATPPLRRLLERDLRLDTRRHVASALVRLGDKAGFPVLIEVLASSSEDGPFTSGYERHSAGEQLNEASGTESYVGRSVKDKDRGYTRWEGNFADAAKAFRTWWEASKDKLAFDPEKGTWSQR